MRTLFDIPRFRVAASRAPLILVNGLAEQSESWFANQAVWSRRFDVKAPEILVYNGDSLHRHIDAGGDVTVAYLTDRLAHFLDEYVQRPPYHFVGSSLGCQVIVTLAARHPEKVARLVLICPSGFHGDENLPVMDGVRRSQYDILVKSVFHRSQFATDDLVAAIDQKFQDRRWKKGVLRTLRGTLGHSVAPLLEHVRQPALVIWGDNDGILADVAGSIQAAKRMPCVQQIVLRNCGHAPQIEKSATVNRLVDRFLRDRLTHIPRALDSSCLTRPSRRPRIHEPR